MAHDRLKECPVCDGTAVQREDYGDGWTFEHPCYPCRGSGLVWCAGTDATTN